MSISVLLVSNSPLKAGLLSVSKLSARLAFIGLPSCPFFVFTLSFLSGSFPPLA